jgi:hypothetical protein
MVMAGDGSQRLADDGPGGANVVFGSSRDKSNCIIESTKKSGSTEKGAEGVTEGSKEGMEEGMGVDSIESDTAPTNGSRKGGQRRWDGHRKINRGGSDGSVPKRVS